MGWPFGSKDKKDEAGAEEPKLHVSSTSLKTPPPAQDAYATDPILSQMPRPSSVFEFGKTLNAGQEYMRGVCTGENPDAIQACTWSVETVAQQGGKSKEKKHLYRVEF